MAAVPQKRSQVKARASDPSPRFVDATAPWTTLDNRDPEKHYVYVYKNSLEFGPEFYENCGYDYVRFDAHDPNSVRPRIRRMRTDGGDLIELQGHVLMCIDKSVLEQQQREGAAGAGLGTAYFDQLEKRIVSERGGADHLRGIQGRFIRAENETTAAAVEED